MAFGSVRLLTDATGAVTDTYDYDGWGNAVNTTGSTPNVYLYRGEQYDPDLGLYYLRARVPQSLDRPVPHQRPYSPPAAAGSSRWNMGAGIIVRVPAGLYRFSNKYLYATANPVNRIDPMGLETLFEYTIMRYKNLIAMAAGVSSQVGMQAHHIIPERFADLFGFVAGEMEAIWVDAAEHQEFFTNAWVDVYKAYGGAAQMTEAEVLGEAYEIYGDYPMIIKSLNKSLWILTRRNASYPSHHVQIP